jgi:hypothetical protein
MIKTTYRCNTHHIPLMTESDSLQISENQLYFYMAEHLTKLDSMTVLCKNNILKPSHVATVYLTSNMSQELLSYHVVIIWQSREICPIEKRAQLICIYTFG